MSTAEDQKSEQENTAPTPMDTESQTESQASLILTTLVDSQTSTDEKPAPEKSPETTDSQSTPASKSKKKPVKTPPFVPPTTRETRSSKRLSSQPPKPAPATPSQPVKQEQTQTVGEKRKPEEENGSDKQSAQKKPKSLVMSINCHKRKPIPKLVVKDEEYKFNFEKYPCLKNPYAWALPHMYSSSEPSPIADPPEVTKTASTQHTFCEDDLMFEFVEHKSDSHNLATKRSKKEGESGGGGGRMMGGGASRMGGGGRMGGGASRNFLANEAFPWLAQQDLPITNYSRYDIEEHNKPTFTVFLASKPERQNTIELMGGEDADSIRATICHALGIRPTDHLILSAAATWNVVPISKWLHGIFSVEVYTPSVPEPEEEEEEKKGK